MKSKNKHKSFLLPIQGKAILRKGSTMYFQEEVAAYLSERDMARDIHSRDQAREISCYKINAAHGINAYCRGIMINSIFHH